MAVKNLIPIKLKYNDLLQTSKLVTHVNSTVFYISQDVICLIVIICIVFGFGQTQPHAFNKQTNYYLHINPCCKSSFKTCET